MKQSTFDKLIEGDKVVLGEAYSDPPAGTIGTVKEIIKTRRGSHTREVSIRVDDGDLLWVEAGYSDWISRA